MARRSYYEVLGVGRGESAEGIRAKFRDLAKRHHPDRTGSEETGPFREIVEAYEALSNPVARSRHDDDLRRASTPDGPGDFPGSSGWRRDDEVLDFDLVLSPSEAARGVIVPVEVPVEVRCSACRGHAWMSLRCVPCGGAGTIRETLALRMQFAPGLRDGSVLDIVLDGLGIPSLPIRMRVVVDVR